MYLGSSETTKLEQLKHYDILAFLKELQVTVPAEVCMGCAVPARRTAAQLSVVLR